MYNPRRSSAPRGGSSRSGSSSFGGARRPGSSFGGAPRGGSSFGGGGRRFQSRKIRSVDPRLLVNTAAQDIPEEVFVPKYRFTDFQIDSRLMANVASKGYDKPTPIQDQCIPHILDGRDVVGIANTGTGKTAAFLIPTIHQILADRNRRALIVAPTRELAVQIEEEARALTPGLSLYSQTCIGGVDMYRQIQGLRRHPHLVIGTPGRLKDLFNRGVLNLRVFNTIVLDEVDRMLDMGFVGDVKFLVEKLNTPRHSLFFSATSTPQIEEIMKAFLKDPIKVSVKTRPTAAGIHQDIIKLNGKPKNQALEEVLRSEGVSKVLVFGRTKHGIERLEKQLSDSGFSVSSIHGNKNQNQRQRALKGFKAGEIDILLATDIASRGLDITGVSHVINYDLPETYEDYVHRIGRTGRAGARGIALTLVD